MRTKLNVLLFIALLVFAQGVFSVSFFKIPLGFSDKEELAEWANSLFGFSNVESFRIKEKNFIVVLHDYGSGMIKMSAYIYVKRKNGWGLVELRRSSSSKLKVSIEQEQSRIILLNSENDVLSVLPLDSLDL